MSIAVPTVPREDPGTMTLRGRYLYAIVDRESDRRSLNLTGIDGGAVYTVGDGRVVAVVSDVPTQKVRPERRRLAAHHEVLKQLMADHAVLPMAFGLIAEGEEAVRRILSLNHGALVEQLERVDGRVEMGLRVKWDVPNIFEYALELHPDLRALRDHLFRDGREPSQDEKIELGRQFDRILTADREHCEDRVVRALQDHCVEVASNKPRTDREVMNLACLVERSGLREFEKGVVEAARTFDQNYAFDYNGPWPAHNFVRIELQMS